MGKKTGIIPAFFFMFAVAAFSEVVSTANHKVKIMLEGTVKSGLRADTTTKKHAGSNGEEFTRPTLIYGYIDDFGEVDDGTALQADITGTARYGLFGLKFNIRQNIAPHGELAPLFFSIGDEHYQFALNNVYGWADLFGQWLSVYGGLIDDGIWGTGTLGDTGTNMDLDRGLGLRLEVRPQIAALQGLSFGVFFDLQGASYDPNGNGEDLPELEMAEPENGAWTVTQFFAEPVFGIFYANDFLGASASLKRHRSIIIQNPSDPTTTITCARGMDLLLGFKIAPIPNLLCSIDGLVSNIGADSMLFFTQDPALWIDPAFELYAHIQYSFIPPLQTGLQYHIRRHVTGAPAPGDDVSAWVTAHTVNDMDILLYATYEINNVITAGLDLQFYLVGLTQEQTEYNALSAGDRAATGLVREDYSSFKSISVKPHVTFNLTDTIRFIVYDAVTINMANYGGAEPNDNYQPSTGILTYPGYIENCIQFDFVWSF
ncbi:MAG: hypothetical protein LBD22_07770 [Spirochaetaceae bacterium]|nr:hypothetical protein [Spirochaetaceae bacterium]